MHSLLAFFLIVVRVKKNNNGSNAITIDCCNKDDDYSNDDGVLDDDDDDVMLFSSYVMARPDCCMMTECWYRLGWIWYFSMKWWKHRKLQRKKWEIPRIYIHSYDVHRTNELHSNWNSLLKFPTTSNFFFFRNFGVFLVLIINENVAIIRLSLMVLSSCHHTVGENYFMYILDMIWI